MIYKINVEDDFFFRYTIDLRELKLILIILFIYLSIVIFNPRNLKVQNKFYLEILKYSVKYE